MPLQQLHHYYELLRPSSLHRYSYPYSFSYSNFSLSIKATGSCSSIYEPKIDSRHLYTEHHLHSNQVTCRSLSQEMEKPLFLMSLIYLTMLQRWFTCVRLSNTYLTQSRRAFSLTLITLTLNQSNLRWFATCSCQPIARGLLSSFAQHHT